MLDQGGGRRPARTERRHQLHRVQLPDPAGAGLPRAVPAVRLHAADRRQRPVGQHHRRPRPDPPRSSGAERPRAARRRWSPRPTARSSARPRAAPSGSTRTLTSPYAFYQFWLNADDRDVGRFAADLHLPVARGDRGARASPTRERPQAREAQRALAEELTDAGARRRPSRPGPRRPARRCSGRASSATWTPRRWRPRSPRPPHRRRSVDGASCRRVVDLLARPGWCASPGAPPAGRSRRAAPTSTTSGSTDEDAVPGGRRLAARPLAGAAPGQAHDRWRSSGLVVDGSVLARGSRHCLNDLCTARRRSQRIRVCPAAGHCHNVLHHLARGTDEAPESQSGRSRGGPTHNVSSGAVRCGRRGRVVALRVAGSRSGRRFDRPRTGPSAKLDELPRERPRGSASVRVRSLRTQQRAESQCQTTPSWGGSADHSGRTSVSRRNSFGDIDRRQ